MAEMLQFNYLPILFDVCENKQEFLATLDQSYKWSI